MQGAYMSEDTSTPTIVSLLIQEKITVLKRQMQTSIWNGGLFCKFWSLHSHNPPTAQSAYQNLSLREWPDVGIYFACPV